MSGSPHARVADEIAREIDLLVYRLEKAPPEDRVGMERAWVDLRRKLERLRERLEDLATQL